MINTLKSLFGLPAGKDLKEILREGSIIVDVRTVGEYKSGHIKNSINIPLDSLSQHLNRFPDKNKAIVVCCASGMRSGAAKRLLQSNG